MITLSIAVNKIDKSKFFLKKNGDKMLDLVLIETPNSKYDTDYMVVQGRTKEERDKDPKAKSVVLGNGKIIESRGNKGNGGAQAQPAAVEGGGSDGW